MEDNSFHFKLCYTGENLGELSGGCNEWRQNSNPVTSTTVEGFKEISLDWREDFGGLCKLEGPAAEKSMIGSCSNNQRFLVGAKEHSDSDNNVFGPLASGVEDMVLYVKQNVSNCGVFTANGKAEEFNFPFRWDYSTFFFEGKLLISLARRAFRMPWEQLMHHSTHGKLSPFMKISLRSQKNNFQQRARGCASI